MAWILTTWMLFELIVCITIQWKDKAILANQFKNVEKFR